jgi:hypothetical protein
MSHYGDISKIDNMCKAPDEISKYHAVIIAMVYSQELIFVGLPCEFASFMQRFNWFTGGIAVRSVVKSYSSRVHSRRNWQLRGWFW